MEKINSRRKVISKIIGGGALSIALIPSKWATPIINSVILPAHAMTSHDADNDNDSNACTQASETTFTSCSFSDLSSAEDFTLTVVASSACGASLEGAVVNAVGNNTPPSGGSGGSRAFNFSLTLDSLGTATSDRLSLLQTAPGSGLEFTISFDDTAVYGADTHSCDSLIGI